MLDDRGTTTTEYALTTLAAATLAGLLLTFVAGGWVEQQLQKVLRLALDLPW
ncbi:hypothetical protein GCM10010185_03960 [Saccharothrix coeruleofusca]|uniref:DUF4244 domain-containing protein n=1 Tax=Saccharothrix coeruleofusca TaxID=33919 RepID=A0A918EAP2_9PSEU|nr:hypothetical protein GCM10010185_03960 [Saccharothrix coeruleofusca]